MAIIPLLVNLAEELSDPFEWDRDFGFGVSPKEIYQIYQNPVHRFKMLHRNRRNPYTLKKSKKAPLGSHIGKDGFQVSMDVQQFKPNEITVKTVDNTVVVEAKHEEREDEYGIITRHFVRKCSLPQGFDSKDVVSTLSSDGILTVKAPLPPEKKSKAKERIIHIQHTGPACDSIKDNSGADNNKEFGKNGTMETESN